MPSLINDPLTLDNPIPTTAEKALEHRARRGEYLKQFPAISEEREADAPLLYDYQTGDQLAEATADELAASIEAAKTDGGVGVIRVDGRACYVVE